MQSAFSKYSFKCILTYYNYRYFNDNFFHQIFDFLLFILDCVSEGMQNIWKEHAQRFDPKINSYKLWMNLILMNFYRKCSKQWICWLQLLQKWLNLAKCLQQPGPQFPPGLEPPFSGGILPPPPLSRYPAFSEANLKNYPPISDSHHETL